MSDTIAQSSTTGLASTIGLASDHAGLELKGALVAFVQELGFGTKDLGAHGKTSCDYPDFADALCAWVLEGKNRRGVLVCGSGIGMSIAANRHKGIRAALCRSAKEAELARQHNDANILCLGERLTTPEVAKECMKQFLNTPFEGGRHARRVEKMG